VSLQSASHCFRAVAGFNRSLVALAPVRDLLFCAKHLFVAAMDVKRPQPLKAGASKSRAG